MARARKTKGASAERPGQADPTAPLDGGELLAAARPVLQLLREDLGKRAAYLRVDRALHARYEDEKAARRTADSFGEWRDGLLAQVAASWFLSCVFVRTLEDRDLLGQARLAGPGATDSQTLFFQLAPSLTERDYLLFVFRELSELPAAGALFDREHSMVWQLSPSADAAKELLRLFRTPSAEEPAFRFGQASTRFLGDLYQDLYEDVRKRYALLQTPDFIESFILDRTLEPAILRFGLDDTALIDPTCGSGHFLLGAYDRLFEHRLRARPGIDFRQAAHEALDAVYGADINPYAVAIARVRLTLSYLEKAGIRRLKDAPALPLHLVVADSLLYNPQHVQLGFEHQEGQSTAGWRAEPFQFEDSVAARNVLHRRYAAVVGNPPYITEKDSAKRETYRAMYPRSAAGKYALSAPFCERFFQLARERGSVGQIIANSFTKREFGKKLIEEFLKNINLEVIVNTSGAFIPGHDTPTVLLFGTQEAPVRTEVLSVLAKRGEPSMPTDPAKGEVWSSIATHWRDLDFDNNYITVASISRDKLASHPWSLGGGGTIELKELMEERARQRLGEVADSIGIVAFTLEDEVFIRPRGAWIRTQCPESRLRVIVIGETIRDWAIGECDSAFFPYEDDFSLMDSNAPELRVLWPWRMVLSNNKLFGNKTKIEGGLAWYEYGRLTADKLRTRLSITFAEVATHNHFVLDRCGNIFNRTAPIIKLPQTVSEDDHLALLAYLNSSTACFWMKQVCYPKATSTKDIDVERGKPEANRFAFSGTAISPMPLPSWTEVQHRQLVDSAREALALAAQREKMSAAELVRVVAESSDAQQSQHAMERDKAAIEERLVAVQEDIDWLVYELFGLAGGFTPTAGGHDEAMRPYVAAVQGDVAGVSVPAIWLSRLDQLGKSPNLQILEVPVFKRLWSGRRGVFGHSARTFDESLRSEALAWCEEQVDTLLRESPMPWSRRALSSVLAMRADVERVASLASLGDSAEAIHIALDSGDVVPYLAAQRFTATGLAKWHEWLQVWEAQRLEDAGAKPPPPMVPPKYIDKDFQEQRYWRLRGKLDVPKERFISYPGCESDEDHEPVYGWAGWNHLQRAQALAALYQKRKTHEGWTRERLLPMLAGLLELLPWVRQWHNEPDGEFDDQRMGDFFAQFLEGECQTLSLTHADLETWRPTRGTKNSTKAARTQAASDDADTSTVETTTEERERAAHGQLHDQTSSAWFDRDLTMTPTIPELLERLREVDECPGIEAKRAATELGRSALDTISAFSNEPGMGGGYLLFGLEEDPTTGRYEIVGVADAKKLEQEIATVCASVFNRAVRPKVWVDRVDGRALVAAFVPEASPHEKPVFLKKSGVHHGTFRRVGSTDQRCTEEDLRVLFRAGDTTAYEDTLARDASTDELDPAIITAYRRQLLDVNPATELRDAGPLGLVQAVGGARREAGQLVPTVVGVFLFGSRLLLRRLFPQHRVDYIRVPGTQWVPDSERRYESVEIRDPLLTAFRRAYQAVIDDLPRSFVLDPGSPERRDQTAVPETVVREALVNALIHRDYRIASAIQVIRYADRIEIRNPGHSLVGAAQFGQPGSYPRNPRIADVFRDMRLAENKGTGIEAMRRAMKRADLVPPVFDSDARGDRFVTTLWFHSLLDDTERGWLDSLGIELTAGQRQALVVARRTGSINNSGLRDLTGLDPLQARRELHRLRELGLLFMRSERGGAYYVLVDSAGAKWPPQKTPESLVEHPGHGSHRGELGPDRGELGPDRGELGPDRGELGPDRGGLGPDSGESKPVHDAVPAFDRSMLPFGLQNELAKLGRRPRQGPLRAVILHLCAWRPLRAAELAAILQVRPDKLTERHLAPMLAGGELARTHPDNPTHPDQAYRAAQRELPADDHDEETGVDDD